MLRLEGGPLPHGFQMRHRRPAQRRQVDALQRADADRGRAGGELSVLHHRAQRRRRRGARSPSRRPGGDRRLEGDHPDPAHLRRHRRPRARRVEGRGARQPVPRQHPRMRRDRPCRALLRGRRRHPRRGPHRPAVRHRHDRDRADARRPREPRAAHRRDGEEGQGRRQGGEGASAPSPSAASSSCARAGRPARPASAARSTTFSQSLGLLSSKPVLYVCNVEEAAADRGNAFSEVVKGQAETEGAVARRRVGQDRERDRHPAPGRAGGLSRGGGP